MLVRLGLGAGLPLIALLALAHGGGLDSKGGHTNSRTGEYHLHKGAGNSANPVADCSERPKYNPRHDVVHMRLHGWVAPYTCRPVSSPKDVDIEHVVAWAEAKRSGLSCARAAEFMDDPLNITVAYPQLNRRHKRDKDAAQWLPRHNRCWFAAKVVEVKRKYRLSMDAAESAAIEKVLAGCSADEKAAPSCPSTNPPD